MKSFLFAYGTLQSSIAPPGIRAVVKYLNPVGKALAKGRLIDLGEYPGAVFENVAPTKVQGTVYSLPTSKEASIFETLDKYEGVSSEDLETGLFVRKKIPVSLRNGKRLDCWVYEYAGDQRMPTFHSGIYPKRRARISAMRQG